MIDQTYQAENTTAKGRFGEKIAQNYLIKKGYAPLAQNYHIQGGELDLVLQKNGIIVFVEVKLRTGKNFGTGPEAVTASKKRKLIRAIFTFLQDKNIKRPWSLDLVDIRFEKASQTAYIQHFTDILEA
jgi:putative endonuclease